MIWPVVLLATMLVASAVSFALYGWDKRSARRARHRVPERTLHLWALAGGWPGALVAQNTFRHKTQKLSFRVFFWATVVIHLAAIGCLAFLLQNGGLF